MVGKGQGVVPQGADLHRLAVPRCDGPAVDHGVHPGELGLLVAHIEEAFLIGMDERHLSSGIGTEDLLDGGPAVLFHKVHALGIGLEQHLHGPDIPEGGVHRVVGMTAVGGKDVGDESVTHGGAHAGKDLLAQGLATGKKRQAGQGDHGVASPGAEPVVSGHDAVDPAGRAAGRGDEETFPFPGQMFLQAVRLFFPEPAQALFLPQTVEVMPAVFLLQALRGNGKVDGMAGNKVHFEGPGHEQVFLEGEAPLLFHEVFDIVVPVLGRLPGGRTVHLQKKLGQLGIQADGSPV